MTHLNLPSLWRRFAAQFERNGRNFQKILLNYLDPVAYSVNVNDFDDRRTLWRIDIECRRWAVSALFFTVLLQAFRLDELKLSSPTYRSS